MFYAASRPGPFAPPRMKARLSREARKELATGKAPVYLRLTHNYESAYVATGVYLLASEWDQKTQAVLGRAEEHDTARSALRVWVGEAEQLSQLHRKTPGMTALKYKNLLLGKQERVMRLLTAADAFYQNKARPELNKAFATLRLYRTSRANLEVYLSTLGELSVSLAAVDLAWVRRFERWCVSTQRFALNTTRKYVGFVQEVMDFAAHETWLPLNPVAKYRYETAAAVSDPRYLPEVEVQAVAGAELPAGLEQARAAWLFCCYTGLSYVDYLRLDTERDVHTDATGRQWVRMERQKTGVKVSIPVLPELAALLCSYSPVLPKPERSYLGKCLKKVSTLLHLSLPLSTGLARHTASHRLRNVLGFTDEEAAAILGHGVEVQHSNYSRKREAGLALALERLGITDVPTPAPSLLEQLRVAMMDPAMAEALRRQLLVGSD